MEHTRSIINSRAKGIMVYGRNFTYFQDACREYGVSESSIRTIARNFKVDYGKAIEMYSEGYRPKKGPQPSSGSIYNGKKDNIFSTIRKDLGLKQTEFAKLLNVSSATISHWEYGCSKPKIETAKRLSQLSGYPLEYFYDLR